MIKNLFFHFGAVILVAAYWVSLVIVGLVAHHFGVIVPVILIIAIVPLAIGVLLVIGIPDIQYNIKYFIIEMDKPQ